MSKKNVHVCREEIVQTGKWIKCGTCTEKCFEARGQISHLINKVGEHNMKCRKCGTNIDFEMLLEEERFLEAEIKAKDVVVVCMKCSGMKTESFDSQNLLEG